MYAIETSELTKYYGKARGIIDLSIQISQGEIFAFIGPNGSGKTTTIRLPLSLLFPTRGSGRIFKERSLWDFDSFLFSFPIVY